MNMNIHTHSHDENEAMYLHTIMYSSVVMTMIMTIIVRVTGTH